MRQLPRQLRLRVNLKRSRSKTGVWEKVFQHLAADADNEYTMIDSTIVRAHQRSAGAKKRHHVATATTVDALCDLSHVLYMFYDLRRP